MLKTFQSKLLLHKVMLKNLQSKLLTLLILSTTLPVTAVGLYGISSSTQALTNLNLNQVENEIAQQAVKIEQVLSNVYSDVLMVSGLPPIQGVVRARDGGGVDQAESQRLTRTTYADWVKRLQQSLRAVMAAKPQYESIQYLDERGNELVQLQMAAGEMMPQTTQQFTNYAQAIYFQPTSQLKSGQVYISPIQWATLPHQSAGLEPVIYYATPVYNETGNFRGLIVVTLLVKAFTDQIAVANEAPGEIAILATKQGQYLVHPAHAVISSQYRHDANTVQQDYPAAIANTILTNPQGSLQTEADRIISYRTIGKDLNHQMVIVYDLPKYTVLQSVSQLKRVALAVVVLSLGTVIAVGGAIVRRISRSQTSLYEQAQAAAIAAEAKAQEAEQALRQLHQTQTQLVQTEKMSSLGQLVAGVAHEINNPVNFIYGNLNHVNEYSRDLLQLIRLYQLNYPQPTADIQAETEAVDLDFLMADMPKMLASMKIGADRIRQIVLSLRNFSRIDEAAMKAVDIHEGIDSTLLILQNRTKPQGHFPGVEIVKQYGQLPLVECYAGQLNQVLMNILSNAIDALEEAFSACPESDWQPRITIETAAIAPDSPPTPLAVPPDSPLLPTWVWIRIQDNGPGIPAQIRDRLFEPFFTTKPIGKGTGLGLSISYQIVTERHQGKLTCFSMPGCGTEFRIEIPIHPPVPSSQDTAETSLERSLVALKH